MEKDCNLKYNSNIKGDRSVAGDGILQIPE